MITSGNSSVCRIFLKLPGIPSDEEEIKYRSFPHFTTAPTAKMDSRQFIPKKRYRTHLGLQSTLMKHLLLQPWIQPQSHQLLMYNNTGISVNTLTALNPQHCTNTRNPSYMFHMVIVSVFHVLKYVLQALHHVELLTKVEPCHDSVLDFPVTTW